MKVYPVFLHRAKHAAKEVQKPWVSAGVLWKPPRCIRHRRIQRGGFEEASRFPCHDGVDFLPLLAESYPPETKYKKRPHSHNKQQSLHHKVEGLLF